MNRLVLQNLRSGKGSSFIELAVYLGVAAVVGLALSAGFRLSKTAINQSTFDSELKTDLALLVQNITRAGRASNACRIPSASVLECDVHMPGTSTTKTVRFEMVSLPGPKLRNVNVIKVSGDGSDPRYFPSPKLDATVFSFQICDTTSMTNSSCSIVPAKISTVWAAIAAGRNSYYRLQLKVGRQGEVAGGKSIEYQSSFFLRNAAPLNGLIFETGSSTE